MLRHEPLFRRNGDFSVHPSLALHALSVKPITEPISLGLVGSTLQGDLVLALPPPFLSPLSECLRGWRSEAGCCAVARVTTLSVEKGARLPESGELPRNVEEPQPQVSLHLLLPGVLSSLLI